MHVRDSFPFPPEAVLGLAAALEREAGADVLCAPGADGRSPTLFMGVAPEEEFVLLPGADAGDMAAFAFADERPTMGLLAYEFGLDRLGVRSRKERVMPRGMLRKYGLHLAYDPEAKRLDLLHHAEPDVRLFDLARRLAATPEAFAPDAYGAPRPARVAGHVRRSLSSEAYEAAVTEVLARIRQGHTYQLNLSVEFRAPVRECDPFALFRLLFGRHPAPHYAYFRCGPQTVISTSPERFLRVADGEVLSQPIKGTLRLPPGQRRKGLAGPPPDLARALRASPKEDAELSMIVDLMRNDVAASCEYGSVGVRAHKSIFVVDDLLQMYSEVTGRLRPDLNVFDLVQEAFPPGSVTGCPKKRSLEIIEELEPHTREAYCGSVLLVHGPRDMDASVAIRTARHDADAEELVFHAGSGIVVDSDPAAEERETVAKADKFLRLMEELS